MERYKFKVFGDKEAEILEYVCWLSLTKTTADHACVGVAVVLLTLRIILKATIVAVMP